MFKARVGPLEKPGMTLSGDDLSLSDVTEECASHRSKEAI